MARKRILLVDDDALGREVLRRSLALIGHRADTAASGEEALSAIMRHRYDLVLLDCRMSGMDGFQTLQRLRAARSAGRRLRVVAMTADSTAAFAKRIRASGFDGFLAKPFRIEQLKALMQQCLAEETRRNDNI